MSFVQLTQDAEGRTEMNSAKSCASFSMLGSATCPELPSLSTSNPDVRPRKMHSSRLSEIRWEALAKGREQRRVLNLRGLPSKLCTTEALQAWLRAEGFGNTVEDLKVFPGKAGRLGCGVVRVREVADVERLAKLFHGRQCGAGSPIAVSFAAPGGLRGSPQPGATPEKVQSSLDVAMLTADFGVLKESQHIGDGNIHHADTVSILAADRPSTQTTSCASSGDSPRGSASSSSVDGDCGDDYICEAGELRPPPGLEGLRWQ